MSTETMDEAAPSEIIAPHHRRGEEWANAVTHGAAALASIFAGWFLIDLASNESVGLALACVGYVLPVVGTFTCSTLSHVFHRQPWLNRFRAWDQAMIYTMIAGTYTPIVFRYAADSVRTPLLLAIWIAAGSGFVAKVALRHRINSISTVTYLLLGWLPAIPLVGQVPRPLVAGMIIGGLLYTIGVAFLINDMRLKYLHAVWHLFVIAAAAVHFVSIWWFVVLTG